jgi:hypothetical protein
VAWSSGCIWSACHGGRWPVDPLLICDETLRYNVLIVAEETKEAAMRRLFLDVLASVALVIAGAPSASAMNFGALIGNDQPGNFFPGKYFEYKAQFYLKNKDYRAALEMFELAGFWANKIAQYNAGLMYYDGIGVPVDKVRGVAWLGIAAEAHDDLADATLQTAYASLSPVEKQQADALWRTLDEKYGDRVTLRRALARYNQERMTATGSHVGFHGNLEVHDSSTGGVVGERGFTYYRRQEQERDKLVAKITGHVTIGEVQTLKLPEDRAAAHSPEPVTPTQPR